MLVDRLHYAMGLDTTGLKMGEVQAMQSLSRIDTKFYQVSKGGPVALALAIGAIGTTSILLESRLETALAEVGTLIDKDVKDLGELRKTIIGLSTRVSQAAEQLTKGLYQTISAGVQNTQQALYVLETASKGAVAGLSDTYTTVDAITNVLNAYQKEAYEAERISDILFTAIKEGKLTMATLAPTIGQVVSSAALAGVTFKEVAAAMATMTKAGYSADESATSLNRLFLAIVDSQEQAKEAARKVGIEWSVDAMRAKGFQRFIKDLNDAAGDNITLLQQIVPEIRAFRAASVVAGVQAKEFSRIMDSMAKSEGATQRAFEQMANTIRNKWVLEKNRIL